MTTEISTKTATPLAICCALLTESSYPTMVQLRAAAKVIGMTYLTHWERDDLHRVLLRYVSPSFQEYASLLHGDKSVGGDQPLWPVSSLVSRYKFRNETEKMASERREKKKRGEPYKKPTFDSNIDTEYYYSCWNVAENQVISEIAAISSIVYQSLRVLKGLKPPPREGVRSLKKRIQETATAHTPRSIFASTIPSPV